VVTCTHSLGSVVACMVIETLGVQNPGRESKRSGIYIHEFGILLVNMEIDDILIGMILSRFPGI
jgi:hypothetical protein